MLRNAIGEVVNSLPIEHMVALQVMGKQDQPEARMRIREVRVYGRQHIKKNGRYGSARDAQSIESEPASPKAGATE